ncbi:MAG: four helix bundle protein [Acidobacteriaceae bacterium]
MKDFHKLKVWERAHNLTLNIYAETQAFPKEEVYGLTNQMRRSPASIPTNIAEGCGRNSKAETVHFFNLAIGSASELEYQLILAHDLHYLIDKEYSDMSNELIEVRKMLYAFANRLKSDIP